MRPKTDQNEANMYAYVVTYCFAGSGAAPRPSAAEDDGAEMVGDVPVDGGDRRSEVAQTQRAFHPPLGVDVLLKVEVDDCLRQPLLAHSAPS